MKFVSKLGRIAAAPGEPMAMIPLDLQSRLSSRLEGKTVALAESLRDILARRPFRYASGFGPGDVEAIRFEYAFDTFETTAYPIHRIRGCCGEGLPLAAIEPVFEASAEREYLESIAEDERDDASSALDDAKKAAFVEWFMDCWRDIRGVAPTVRGFLSVHDTICVTDLDTGEKMKADDTGFQFY